MQSNIKVLDLSYNNISDITKYYFKPVEYSLTHLYLSNNQLRNITQRVFGNMPHLQWLDLRHNGLMETEFDCFKNTKDLQVLLLSWNEIMDIPVEVLRPLKKLRIVDLSHNKLRTLQDGIFTDASIESLDLSHNQFTRLPVKSMSLASAARLANLDMSWNFLSGIHNIDSIFRLRVSSENTLRYKWNQSWNTIEIEMKLYLLFPLATSSNCILLNNLYYIYIFFNILFFNRVSCG